MIAHREGDVVWDLLDDWEDVPAVDLCCVAQARALDEVSRVKHEELESLLDRLGVHVLDEARKVSIVRVERLVVGVASDPSMHWRAGEEGQRGVRRSGVQVK